MIALSLKKLSSPKKKEKKLRYLLKKRCLNSLKKQRELAYIYLLLFLSFLGYAEVRP